jgi:WD40 repeat protein
VPHVTDFGLAKQVTRELGGTLTESGYLLGTPSYVSPEQAQGAKNVDRRTDVWSLGIMLYEVLTGKLPFEGLNALDIVLKTIRDPIEPPSATTRRTTLASTDRALETICMRALCKSADDRYPTAAAMAEDMTRWLQGRRVLATPPRSKPPRWKIAAAAAAVAVAILGGILLKGALSEHVPTPEERGAEFVLQARKLMLQDRHADALIAFGRALEEDPRSKVAAAGKKEAQDKLITAAKPAQAKAAPAAPDPLSRMVEGTPLKAHASGVNLVRYAPDGRSMVTGGFDNILRLWDLPQRTERKRLSEGSMPISAAVSPDGRWIAAGFMDGSLTVWDGAGAAKRAFAGHKLQVTGVAFSPDGTVLASTSTDDSARLWDTFTGTEKTTFRGFPKGAMCLAISRDGKMIAVGAADRLVRVLNVPRLDVRTTLEDAHKSEVLSAAFSADGEWLVSGGPEGSLLMAELSSGRRQQLVGHSRKVNGIAFSPDGRWFVTTSGDSTARLWEARTGTPLGVLRFASPAFGVAFSPDGQQLSIGLGDGTLRCWTLPAVTAAK